MGVKDLFSHGRTISRKFLRKNYRQDPTFQKMMNDPEIKKAIDRPEEQRELHNMLMEQAGRGPLKGDDMRIVFDKLARKGKGEHISSEEGRKVAARVFTDSSRRYKSEKPDPAKISNNTAEVYNDRPTKNPAISQESQSGKVPPAYFTYRSKSVSASTDSEKPTEKKTSFFDALRSMARNQKK